MFSFKNFNRESMLHYVLFFGASFIIQYATGITEWLSHLPHMDLELATTLMALVTVLVKKFVMPVNNLPSK